MTPSDAESPRPLICGHRGAAAVAAENTIASFDAAIERGAQWVEFDVRPTGDGALVVHHDPVTAAGLHIATAARSSLDASIPSFGDVVQRCGAAGIGLDIEVKTDDVGLSAAAYVAVVERELRDHCGSYEGEIVVTSFDVEMLAGFRSANPDVRTGLLFHDRTADWAIGAALAAGHAAIAPWYKIVDTDVVSRAHAAGLEVMTWTVNRPEDIVRMADAGVDMIIGDDPAVIAASLGR
jgi:glycerophosphoryl diester phosphodiesterase